MHANLRACCKGAHIYGSGADIIAKGWEENHWARPTITEQSIQPEYTELILDLLKEGGQTGGQSTTENPKNVVDGVVDQLTKRQRLILTIIRQFVVDHVVDGVVEEGVVSTSVTSLPNAAGFHWTDVDPNCMDWTPAEYQANLTHPLAERQFKNNIDAYNKGGSENEDYYEKLLQLIDDLKKEQARTTDLGLTEEEMEIYDLLIKDRKLTKAEEQKVILAAKNLYHKLVAEKERIMVIDWYKDEQPKQKVVSLIKTSLNEDLPESYDKPAFDDKTTLLLNHFIDMAVQGYGWLAA